MSGENLAKFLLGTLDRVRDRARLFCVRREFFIRIFPPGTIWPTVNLRYSSLNPTVGISRGSSSAASAVLVLAVASACRSGQGAGLGGCVGLGHGPSAGWGLILDVLHRFPLRPDSPDSAAAVVVPQRCWARSICVNL